MLTRSLPHALPALLIIPHRAKGYASGDSERDATVIRRYAEAGVHLAVCNSYSKVPPPSPSAWLDLG
jgi:hypothetical protein